MNSRTRIIVLHMKEIIYTTVFLCLAALLIFLLIYMFTAKEKEEDPSEATYQPGVYTAPLPLKEANLEIAVTVDEHHINDIRFTDLEETVRTAYPLIAPALDTLSRQIYDTQSLTHLTYPKGSTYTCELLKAAIEKALAKAR